MTTSVRAMTVAETGLIIDYFCNATPEHLEMLGVDPTRLPVRTAWHERLTRQLELPVTQRAIMPVTWLQDDRPIGFSIGDKIVFGQCANMHLHVISPKHRSRGTGAECVRQSVDFYFETLQLKRLFCEPNAF